MYKIAIAPMQQREQVTLFARTDEWLRFITHLRTTKYKAYAMMVERQLDTEQDVNTLRMSKSHARVLLSAAGSVL